MSTLDTAPEHVDAIAGLTREHLAELRASGLTDATIAASGIYSEHDAKKLGIILGWDYPRRCGVAMVFRYLGSDGHRNGYCRVKPSTPRTIKQKPVKYESPKGERNRPYFPADTFARLQDVDVTLMFTEGEKKSLAVDQAGIACVGLVGVHGWMVAKSADRLIPELDAIPLKGRRVFIAFDSDRSTKPDILDAESRLAAQLRVRGAVVKIVCLPDGPDGARWGVDDFLVAKGTSELHRLLNEAQDPEPVDAGLLKRPASKIDSFPEAEDYFQKHHAAKEGKSLQPTLRYYHDEFFCYDGAGYRKAEESDIRSAIKRFLHPNYSHLTIGSTSNVLDAVKSLAHIPSTVEVPAFIGGGCLFDPKDILATKTGLIHLPTLVAGGDYLIPPTARFFTFSGLDYGFLPDPPEPKRWLQFLAEIFSGDPESIATLQEWFGLTLTPDTSHHKILGLIGPTRCGKGTIARVNRELIGPNNAVSPTLAGLGTNFGLWPLIGKTLAVISDARLSGRTDAAVVTERLLSISGEDSQTIDRKCMQPVTTKLSVRFAILTNEIPKLADSSGALAGRMIALRFTKSFYGHEDRQLTDKLLEELPGILWWSIEGWRRLRERGHFIQPESGADLVADMRDITSPVGEFVREMCIVTPLARVSISELYGRWKSWCESVGRKEPGLESSFGRDLRSVVPTLKVIKTREGGCRERVYEGIGLHSGG